MPPTLAFVMDPLERVEPDGDTSFAFMLAGQARGYRILHVDPAALTLIDDEVFLPGRVVTVRDPPGPHFAVVETARVAARDCAAIFIRTDPPFDTGYLTATLILSFAEQRGVRVINSPRGLREANEHLYGLNFPALCPPTLVTSSPAALLDFVASASIGGDAIGKPIDGHAGRGVVRLRDGDPNLPALVDLLTAHGRRATMAQAFVPEAAVSVRRLFLIDGELRAVLGRAAPTARGANPYAAGLPEAATISESDRAIGAALAPRLRSDGLFFVGADVAGDRLLEINVTSPTLVRELVALGGPDLAAEVIESLARPPRAR